MFKKILSVLLIFILVISSIGACSASSDIKIKFDNRGPLNYDQIVIYSATGDPMGDYIYKEKKKVYCSCDRTFTISKEKFRNAKYMDIVVGADHLSCKHHITLSDEFKQTIPDKITFVGDYSRYYSNGGKGKITSADLHLILYNHNCYAYCYLDGKQWHGQDNSIEYTFKKWGN